MSTAEQYVATATIRREVSGREAEILSALGIRWTGGSQHITCPYPAHTDKNPSWRWDAVKVRAYCTCAPSHSIFDVTRNMNGVGFEEAKIKVAEMIGRPDLICGRSAQTYSRADAASLLHPAPENKDDDLGWQYLAHRLGLEPNMVPRPLTKVVGLRQLAYFDAPRQKGEKPLHVGDFPAAVFETIDRNDGRHAHRIYLASAGLGKAELGHSADGTRRKSARKIGNEKTTGRSVIWGDPSKAETAIICEGIETAAAVAFAVNTEITSGTVMVAACITATGIEAFQPWPKHGLNIEEFPQSPGNLTIASQNLYELVEGRNIVLYPDAAMRLAVSRAIAIETPRGWRIAKEKQSHKIDVVVALGMAAHAAVKSETESSYVSDLSWVGAKSDETPFCKPRSAWSHPYIFGGWR